MIKKTQLVSEIFRVHLKPKEQVISETVKKIDTRLMILDIFFNRRPIEEVNNDLGSNVLQLIDEFRSMVEQVSKALDKIAELA